MDKRKRRPSQTELAVARLDGSVRLVNTGRIWDIGSPRLHSALSHGQSLLTSPCLSVSPKKKQVAIQCLLRPDTWPYNLRKHKTPLIANLGISRGLQLTYCSMLARAVLLGRQGDLGSSQRQVVLLHLGHLDRAPGLWQFHGI
jgi:hypothetical protein